MLSLKVGASHYGGVCQQLGRVIWSKVDSIMRMEQCIKILEENIKHSAENLQLGHHWTYQQANDPKHTANTY